MGEVVTELDLERQICEKVVLTCSFFSFFFLSFFFLVFSRAVPTAYGGS